jgi:hypothetical protein
MPAAKPIVVTSHVGRDFLQNSAYFASWPKIAWEYISNSLDNAKENLPPIVIAEFTSNYIAIADNGMGMSRQELGDFFRMHGENMQHKRGKRARGRFGTGKSAAFGLANCLRIFTTQNGIRNAVELRRSDIEAAQDGQPFPVKDLVIDGPTNESDGTRVEIHDLILKRVDVNSVIAFLERNLSRAYQNAHVTVNGHVCTFEEPLSVARFEFSPPPAARNYLGDIQLIIKVSPTPLDEDTRGIDVLSHGIWHGSTLAGVDKRERANFIFGEVEVPVLEDGDWPIPAFDNTRNNTLNQQNPTVAVLLSWISKEIEAVRQKLVDDDHQKRKSEALHQLAREAQKIAEILNDDLASQELEFDLTHRIARRSGGSQVSEVPNVNGQLWPGGGDIPTPWDETGQAHGDGKRGNLAGEGEIARPGPTARPGDSGGTNKNVIAGQQKSRRGGLSIEYDNFTSRKPRSWYEQDTKTIWINLDHPQIERAFEHGGKRVDDQQFREICCEVAAVEYAIVLEYEKLNKCQQTAEEALFEVRETIGRVTARLTGILSS